MQGPKFTLFTFKGESLATRLLDQRKKEITYVYNYKENLKFIVIDIRIKHKHFKSSVIASFLVCATISNA
jgi:hypothetical protein